MRIAPIVVALLWLSALALAQTPVNGNKCSGTSSATCNIPAISATAGNNVVVMVGTSAGSSSTSSVTDTNSDTFSVCGGPVNGGNNAKVWLYCATFGTTNASEVITCNATSGNLGCAAEQYSGGFVNVDKSAISTDSTSTTSWTTSNTATTTAATELLVGGCYSNGSVSTITAGTNYTSRQGNLSGGPPLMILEDRNVSSTGAYAATASSSNARFYGCVIVTLKGAPPVDDPTFSPVAGSYNAAQSVTISTTTGGATICYTTDGSTPAAATPGTCSAGSTYSTPVSVSVSETIKALGTLAGDTNSSVVSATYTLVTVAPTCTPVGGTSAHYTFTSALASTSPSPTIVYCQDTINTCTPTTSYSVPVTVSATGYLRSAATTSGWSQSAVTSCQYSIFPPITQISGKTRWSGKTQWQ